MGPLEGCCDATTPAIVFPEYRVDAAHRVIDPQRSVAEVARELDLHENLLHKWVRDERRRMAAAGCGPRSDPIGSEPRSADERGIGAAAGAGRRAVQRHRASGKGLGILCGAASKVSRYELMPPECACDDVT